MQRFYKYHGAGNDFIFIHNLNGLFNDNANYIQSLCNRRTGIGADGLILVNASKHKNINFEMRYFNADGFEGTMCGNGGRCAVAFANKMELIKDEAIFKGIDGIHAGKIITTNANSLEVILQMKDVSVITPYKNGYYLNTGSPHVVKFVENIETINVITEGKRIRHHSDFPQGTNVNFVEIKENHLFVRTFERGVEDETLSCGTGVTASALAYSLTHPITEVNIQTLGGQLIVYFEKHDNSFKNILLRGPVSFVFEGILP